jgi:hypothetical protein
MDMKNYWVFVAGALLLTLFVLLVAMGAHRGGRHHGSGGWAPWGPRPYTPHATGYNPALKPLYEMFSSQNPTFTMFGVDWCPHCVSARPKFESLGSIVTIDGQQINLRYVNPEEDKAGAAGYELAGYPTFYLDKGAQKIKYQGPRTAEGFQAFLKKELSA